MAALAKIWSRRTFFQPVMCLGSLQKPWSCHEVALSVGSTNTVLLFRSFRSCWGQPAHRSMLDFVLPPLLVDLPCFLALLLAVISTRRDFSDILFRHWSPVQNGSLYLLHKKEEQCLFWGRRRATKFCILRVTTEEEWRVDFERIHHLYRNIEKKKRNHNCSVFMVHCFFHLNRFCFHLW